MENPKAHLEEQAKIAGNYTKEDWAAVLSAAPITALFDETDYRLQILKNSLDLFRGSEARKWN